MLETQKKQIGDHTYRVTQLGAIKGRKVLTRLLKMVGPAIETMSKETDTGALLGKLASGLDDDAIDYLCDTFAARTEVQLSSGKSVELAGIFELHFAGKYGEMLKWLAFCVEVNFGEFLKGLASGANPGADSPQASE